MMDRRTFIAGAGVVVLAAPLATQAQQAGKGYRIGFLSPAFPSDPRAQRFLAAFRNGLGELGYVEGQTIAIESRWAAGHYERQPGRAEGPARTQQLSDDLRYAHLAPDHLRAEMLKTESTADALAQDQHTTPPAALSDAPTLIASGVSI